MWKYYESRVVECLKSLVWFVERACTLVHLKLMSYIFKMKKLHIINNEALSRCNRNHLEDDIGNSYNVPIAIVFHLMSALII